MSPNYFLWFTVFLLFLVTLNIYFFYILKDSQGYSSQLHLKNFLPDSEPNIFKEIHEYLQYLPSQYRIKNAKFTNVQRYLIKQFNSTLGLNNFNDVWKYTEMWDDPNSLFPHKDGWPGQLLQAMQQSEIALASNAPKGTQLKLLFILEGRQKLFFKPKRYDLDQVINGNIYAGFDRHNSEVFAYYLAMVLNFTWVAPSVIRKVNVKNTIVPTASIDLRKTMTRNHGNICIYGKCYYCKFNETVCEDSNGEIEGAAILYLDKQFKVYSHPWRRSYNSKKMEWESDINYCKKIKENISTDRLLNLIDVAIFDFLLQNGDRHHYEMYKNKIILLDNGKGLGNPMIDEMDILAPLYHCCVLRLSTWQRLELLSGGSLSETLDIILSLQKEKIITKNNLNAIERRLLKIYATIQLCIGKYGGSKVFKILDNT